MRENNNPKLLFRSSNIDIDNCIGIESKSEVGPKPDVWIASKPKFENRVQIRNWNPKSKGKSRIRSQLEIEIVTESETANQKAHFEIKIELKRFDSVLTLKAIRIFKWQSKKYWKRSPPSNRNRNWIRSRNPKLEYKHPHTKVRIENSKSGILSLNIDTVPQMNVNPATIRILRTQVVKRSEIEFKLETEPVAK